MNFVQRFEVDWQDRPPHGNQQAQSGREEPAHHRQDAERSCHDDDGAMQDGGALSIPHQHEKSAIEQGIERRPNESIA